MGEMSDKHWVVEGHRVVEGPSDGFMNDDGSYGHEPDFDHDMPHNIDERLRAAEIEIKRLRALIDTHNDERRECPVIE